MVVVGAEESFLGLLVVLFLFSFFLSFFHFSCGGGESLTMVGAEESFLGLLVFFLFF